jgi:drug/metabolite transporter (DMT)-like permease
VAEALSGARPTTDNQRMDSPSRAVGVAAAVITVALWTGFIVVGRASAAHTLLPFDIALLRIVGAALVALPCSLWLTHRHGNLDRRKPSAATGGGASRFTAMPTAEAPGANTHATSMMGLSPLPWRPTVAVGLSGGLIYSFLCYAGFFYAPAAHASVLMPGIQPLWAGLLAVPLLGEALTRTRVASLALILLGGLVVGAASLHSALSGDAGVWRGDAIFLLAGMFWALYGVLARRYRIDPVPTTLAMSIFAAFTYVPLFAVLVVLGIVPTHLLQAPWSEIGVQLLFQGVFVVIVAGITFVTMIQMFGPVRSTMITALVPGLSAVGAMLFLHEPVGFNAVVGLVLVTGGILLGVRPDARIRPAALAVTVGPPCGRADGSAG